MMRLLFTFLTLTTTMAFASNGLEGRGATLAVEIKGLSVTSETLVASGLIKNSAFDTGLYFEPKNKEVLLDVPAPCRSLAELAFAQNLKLTVKGELKRFTEHFLAPNEVTFVESKTLKCEVVRAKDR